MSSGNNISSRSRIKIFGDHKDIKDFIFELPKSIKLKYFYCIFANNLRFKIGITENPRQRLKTHEHGLLTYAGAEIRYTLISHPLLEAEKLEKELMSVFSKKYTQISEEFFQDGHFFEVFMEIFAAMNKYQFSEIPSTGSYYDKLFNHIERYFAIYKNETFFEAPINEFMIEMTKEEKEDKRKIKYVRKKIKYLCAVDPVNISFDIKNDIVKIKKNLISVNLPTEERDMFSYLE